MDDLEWLDSLPDEWKVPAELGVPTRNPFNNFVIQVLSSPRVSNGVSLVMGDLLAEKERFTTWYMTEAKGSVDDRRLLELSIESRVRELLVSMARVHRGITAALNLP